MDYDKINTEELLREEERLKGRLEEIKESCLKEGKSYAEFCEAAKKEAEGLYFIDKHKRLRMNPVVEYGKEWKGDTYTLEEFKAMAKNKAIVDDDGYGYYATESAKSDIIILPSDVMEGLLRDDFTHVIWFNR